MLGYDDEKRVSQLLAPLRQIEPVTLPRAGRQRRSLGRPVLVAVVAACALAGAGVAIADGLGVFNGLSAAEREQVAADTLDPRTAAFLRQSPMKILSDSVRLVGQLPSGRHFYVAADVNGDLCVVVEQQMVGCGPALTRDHPITIAYMSNSKPGAPPASYGVAMDGVTAVSFVGDGQQVTVPVENNVWAYEGASSVLQSATVHFADGTSLVLDH